MALQAESYITETTSAMQWREPSSRLDLCLLLMAIACLLLTGIACGQWQRQY